MKTFEVEIQATVRKSIFVIAPDEDAANEMANEQFSVLNDGGPEHYEQETLNVCKVSDEVTA